MFVYRQRKLFCSVAGWFSLKVRDGYCLPESLWGEENNKANNSVSIMILALVHTVDLTWFPPKWQYPDPAVQCVCVCVFSIKQRRESSDITTWGFQNNLQKPSVLRVYRSEMTRSEDVAIAEKKQGCRTARCVCSGNTTKGLPFKWRTPTEQKTWLLAHRLSITATESRPLTGCDLDRWMARPSVVCGGEGRTAVWDLTAGFEIITQALCLQAD